MKKYLLFFALSPLFFVSLSFAASQQNPEPPMGTATAGPPVGTAQPVPNTPPSLLSKVQSVGLAVAWCSGAPLTNSVRRYAEPMYFGKRTRSVPREFPVNPQQLLETWKPSLLGEGVCPCFENMVVIQLDLKAHLSKSGNIDAFFEHAQSNIPDPPGVSHFQTIIFQVIPSHGDHLLPIMPLLIEGAIKVLRPGGTLVIFNNPMFLYPPLGQQPQGKQKICKFFYDACKLPNNNYNPFTQKSLKLCTIAPEESPYPESTFSKMWQYLNPFSMVVLLDEYRDLMLCLVSLMEEKIAQQVPEGPDRETGYQGAEEITRINAMKKNIQDAVALMNFELTNRDAEVAPIVEKLYLVAQELKSCWVTDVKTLQKRGVEPDIQLPTVLPSRLVETFLKNYFMLSRRPQIAAFLRLKGLTLQEENVAYFHDNPYLGWFLMCAEDGNLFSSEIKARYHDDWVITATKVGDNASQSFDAQVDPWTTPEGAVPLTENRPTASATAVPQNPSAITGGAHG